MDNKEFKQIMEALKELSIDQAVLKEKVEAHLKIVDKHETEINEVSKLANRHDVFMKASLWVFGFLASAFGIKLFQGGS